MVESRVDEGLVVLGQAGLVNVLAAAEDLGDVVASELDVDTARGGAQGAVHLEEAADLVEDRLEAAGLVAVVGGDGVAVHGVGDPGDGAPVSAHRLHQRRQGLADAVGTHTGDEGQASGQTLGVETVHEPGEIVGGRGGANLDTHGVVDTGEDGNMGAVCLTGALPHPEHVGGGVVEAPGAGVLADHGILVLQEEGLVGGVEVDLAQGLEVHAGGLHEAHGPVELLGEGLEALVGGVGGEAAVPGVDLAQVRVTAHREGADEVEGGARAQVGVQHAGGVGDAGLGGELVAVDGVAAEGGQGDLSAGLGVRAAGLGVLAGHAADLDHGRGGAVGEDRGHLEDGLDLEADVVGRVVGEGLGAVPAHEDEGLPGAGLGDELTQGVDLSGEDERGPAAQVRHHVGKRGLIRVGGLLEGGQVAPCGGLGVRAGGGELVHHARQHKRQRKTFRTSPGNETRGGNSYSDLNHLRPPRMGATHPTL